MESTVDKNSSNVNNIKIFIAGLISFLCQNDKAYILSNESFIAVVENIIISQLLQNDIGSQTQEVVLSSEEILRLIFDWMEYMENNQSQEGLERNMDAETVNEVEKLLDYFKQLSRNNQSENSSLTALGLREAMNQSESLMEDSRTEGSF